MLLTLLGKPTNRREALRLFDARPNKWTGASHHQIRAIVKGEMLHLRAQWRHRRPRNASSFLRMSTSVLERGYPVLTTARCFHRSYKISCGHAFLVTGGNQNAAD